MSFKHFKVATMMMAVCSAIIFLAPRLRGQDTSSLVNVALASRGAEIDASDYFDTNIPDNLIDGTIGNSVAHRWHSDTSKPFPHWVQLKFPKAMHLRAINFYASSVDCFPTQVCIAKQEADGTLTPLLESRVTPGPTASITLPPSVTTDNLRITLLASNSANPNYVQFSSLEVMAAITPEQFQSLTPSIAASDEGPSGETNVALASAGSVADVSSTGIFGRNHPDYGKQDMLASAAQLIDGRHVVFGGPTPTTPDAPDPASPYGNRWISQVDQ